ncbi:BTB/POZ domain and ankyrin repeat-containing protein NPR1-like [Telopea speciosissima]|uniref:BTB/POZ domain and ankyrin repeat-containing protein NPR1-like n=1 Tax=Telopea speciosissima TaxID=54955 RepID=UPI001CC7616B|nr:BTB/POZ domain and ankyrin repeat-containing protein NPR1-like [Telopea speciosissima]XP_043706035.1 BTB/POZ domain and ankyrin repeat-containing protein NPR1-like [Telopea speciosissima]
MESRTTLSDSNDNSGSSSICFVSQTETLSSETCADVAALRRLSENLESIFGPDFEFWSDAKIVVDGDRQVPVHRCILSARSPFFRKFFSSPDRGVGEKFELKELTEDFKVGFDALVAVLGYLYSGKVKPLPKDVYVCVDEDCSHIGCRPAIDFMVEVLYASFTFQISELVALYQRHLLDILDKVAIDDLLVILSVANMCDKASERLRKKCADIVVKSDIDIITLEKALPHDIVKQIMDSREELGLHGSESNKFPDKHVKRIHRALDSDDVELVRMLLKEGHTTLDDACALHYAVAYCDAKTTTELLDLGLSDVNNLNPRGYTVLHVAAMRKEPKIIVSLLTKGARPSDLTPDGRKALQISKRLTKSVDYNRSTEEGKASPKDRLCIEILEQAERRDPVLGEASVSLAMAGDDLRMKLLYLENRVGLAKLLFPMEAKVAMDIAQVDGTLEFPLTIHSRNAPGGQRTVDLNEAPFRIEEQHLNRMKALSKTVELGKRFFPRCSDVLNKIMDADDLSELAYVGNDTPEERQLKKRRYMELQDILTKAFNEDKEEFDKSAAISSSSSTTSLGVARSSNRFTLNKQNTNH